jgi:hypothetical protein
MFFSQAFALSIVGVFARTLEKLRRRMIDAGLRNRLLHLGRNVSKPA